MATPIREVVFAFSTDNVGGEVRFRTGKDHGQLWAEAYDKARKQIDTSQGERITALERLK